MEIYIWKWMVVATLECMKNADIRGGEVNDNIVLDVRLL